jgi:hypothetical protein
MLKILGRLFFSGVFNVRILACSFSAVHFKLRHSPILIRARYPIFGLARVVASWYSPGGRKAEWIETHSFYSRFGESIPLNGAFPQMDFYLLPTFQEVTDPNNPLTLFPRFKALCDAAEDFHNIYCSVVNIGNGLSFSKFNPPFAGILNTKKILQCIHSPRLNANSHAPLTECFNAFDKGPMRTVMFLQLLNDIKSGRLNPQTLTPTQVGRIYDGLHRFYQTPKVIALYAQQCFGNESALPVDTWIKTFMKWPLSIYPVRGTRLRGILTNAGRVGKLERLLWIAAQSRKVHSSLCNDALWCVKYDSSGKPRGSNPLACKACFPAIRNNCPAYASISHELISFNAPVGFGQKFEIRTSNRNNTTANQRFILCQGTDKYGEIHDDFTPQDSPTAFAPFPQTGHNGQPLTVDQFIQTY